MSAPLRSALLLLCLAAAVLGAWWFLREEAPPRAARLPIGRQAPTAPAPEPPGAGPKLEGGGTRPADLPPAREAPASSGREDAVVLTGRVVGPDRRPVSGAQVEVLAPDRRFAQATSATDGTFRVPAGRPSGRTGVQAAVVARDPKGRVATRPAVLYAGIPDEMGVGTLVLLPGRALAIEVADDDGPVAAAEVEVRAAGPRGGRTVARATTDAAGQCGWRALPAGSYRVLARARGRGRGTATVAVPEDGPGPVRVALPATRTVEVVVVGARDGQPLVGARLELWEDLRGAGWRRAEPYAPARPIPPTDAAGATRIAALGATAPLMVVVRAAGWPAPANPMGFPGRPAPVLGPDATSLRIEWPGARTLRWPIVDADGPVPADGTALALRPVPGTHDRVLPGTAQVQDGHVVASGFGPGRVDAYAATPGGAIARLMCRADRETGSPTSFRAGRVITVRARLPDGSAPSGLWAVARDQGSNPLHDPVALDAQGETRIEGLHGRRVDVYLGDAPRAAGRRVGTVDLAAGNGHLEAAVEPRRRAVLEIRIDGRAALPSDFTLYLAGAGRVEVAEDVERGELHFSWRPAEEGGQARLRLVAAGHRAERAQLVAGRGGETDRARIDLTSSATLTARVALPADGAVFLALERWEEAEGRWVMRSPQRGPALVPDANGLVRVEGLAAGRYRLVEGGGGLVSDAVRIGAADPPGELHFDCSAAGWAEGRVVLPPGTAPSSVRVRLQDAPRAWNNPAAEAGVPVDGEGRFRVRVPGSTPVTLVPHHPELAPAEREGRVRVTAPVGDILLRLESRSTLVFRLGGDASGDLDAAVRVLWFAGPPTGTPVHARSGRATGGLVRLGGFTPGTWTLWIDVAGCAPLLLESARLGAGETDLGPLALSRGTVLRVRVLVAEGAAVPRMFVSARHAGTPAYVRAVNSRGEAWVEVAGLGAGRFQLRIGPTMDSATPEPETIDVDGSTPIERVYDAR